MSDGFGDVNTKHNHMDFNKKKRGKYPAKSFPGFFPGKTAFTDRE